ncbi:tRNA uridine-5-carboxymethylaminomethyl(34) synthesis GTPase MnmE [Hyphomonas sp.]|uniref:tRNA uridine-5-carboxymethylaminomethyl(34) synthesis GTPase MnmE n=1 Tax=Hyphomonas sp. TaxID=87 RepID=UPI0039197EEE
MRARDTICALASGPPPSAIAVIRISGPAVTDIAGKLLASGLPDARRAALTYIYDETGAPIDQGIALYAKGPASYTGEDTLELYLHGGRAVVDHALRVLTALPGVRLAEPGEFTRRAFEAGKLDLAQAEGIADLIEAETDGQKAQALRQVSGGLSATYASWRDDLTGLLALVEVMVDFPDEGDVSPEASAPLRDKLSALIAEIDTALGDGGIGERIREGFRVAILGAPNAGKSTLLNRLAGREAAIVTATPGTTRDVIEIRRTLGGQVVWFADTAGLRETSDEIEAEGVRRAIRTAAEADLVIHLIDGSAPPEPPPPLPFGAEILTVLSKSDLSAPAAACADHIISALTGEGLAALEADIAARITARAAAVEAPVITRLRHRERLLQGRAALASALATLEAGDGFELVAEDLRLAARHLSALLGRVDVEDVLGAVFSAFCIGK